MNRIHNPRFISAFTALVVLSIACSGKISIFETPAHPSVETLVAETVAEMTENVPKATVTLTPTATPIPATATLETFGEVYVFTIVQNVNLRTNPGTLFTVSRVMPQDTRLRLLGQAPGGEWLNVMNDEGIAGWVNVNVVLMAYDGPPSPVIEPVDVILVTGSVKTELGIPVSGIGFAVYQGARRTDALTDADGQFYAYLPPTMNGIWTVDHVAISCTSNTMDTNCNCINGICGTSHPLSTTINLPQSEPLKFVWK